MSREAIATTHSALAELQAVIDLLPVPTCLLDGRWQIARANAEFCSLTGYARERLKSVPADAMLIGDAADAPRVAALRQGLADGSLREANDERAVRGSDGRLIWCQIRTRMVTVGGRPYAMAVFHDLTLVRERQQMLLSQQELFRQLFEASPVAISMQDDAYRIVECNAAYEALLGRSRASLIGKDPIGWADHETALRMRANRARLEREAIVGGDAIQRLIRADGVLLECHVFFSQSRSLGRGPLLVAALIDRSRERAALDVAQAQSERILELFRHAPVGILARNRDGEVTLVNQTAAAMAGLPADGLTGRRSLFVADEPLDSPDDAPAELSRHRVRSHDGRSLLLDIWTRRVDLFDGMASSLSILVDGTAERQLEEELQRAVLQQGALLRAMAGGVLYVEHETIVRASATIRRLLGWDPSSLRGRAIGELLGAPAVWQGLMAAFDRLQQPDGRVATQLELTHSDGHRVSCDIQVTSIDPSTARLGWVVSIHDITEYKRLERLRLDEVVAQREALIREVNHRIKNNLQGVAGLLQQLAASRPQVADLLREAISQILAIATIHGLQLDGSRAVAIQALVAAIVPSLQHAFGARIALTTQATDEVRPARWLLAEQEAVPIALVVNELLTNALKHRSHGDVSIATRPGDDGFAIEIRNPGRLPDDFAFDKVSAASIGLGLVKALLPRRGASLRFTQLDTVVLVSLVLTPPALRKT